jgi:hypothetical protein
VCEDIFCRTIDEWVATGEYREVIREPGPEGEVQITGVASQLCPTTEPQFGVRYVMTAAKGDGPAEPLTSNTVEKRCDEERPSSPRPGTSLSDEIPGP